MKIPTSIVITDMSTKWGLVTVMNPDTSIAREYEITGAEADAVAKGNSGPPGCTKAEWESGLVMVACRPCLPGMAVINPNGTMVVNSGKKFVGGRVQVKLTKLQPSEYAVVGNALHVESGLAAGLALTG